MRSFSSRNRARPRSNPSSSAIKNRNFRFQTVKAQPCILPEVQIPENLLEFCPFHTEIEHFTDEIFDSLLAVEFSEKFVSGEEAPIKTPLKKKKPVPVETCDSDDEIFTKPSALPVKPKKLPVPSGSVISDSETFSSNPTSLKNVSSDEIEKTKIELKQRYSQHKVVELRKMLDRESLPKTGKKVELVNRLVDQSLRSKYGSPRMRNSYQNAMAAPLS